MGDAVFFQAGVMASRYGYTIFACGVLSGSGRTVSSNHQHGALGCCSGISAARMAMFSLPFPVSGLVSLPLLVLNLKFALLISSRVLCEDS